MSNDAILQQIVNALQNIASELRQIKEQLSKIANK
jgi:hypothetical protein